MPRPKHWPYVAKKNTGSPRLSSLSLRDNKLFLDSKELTGIKNFNSIAPLFFEEINRNKKL